MERLIESVRKYPCLWDINLPEYKIIDVKEAAWKEVVKECNLPDIKEARSQWKKLRDCHRQAVTRRQEAQEACSQSKWKYETQMEFLLPSMQNRSRTVNVNIKRTHEQTEKSENLNDNDVTDKTEDEVPYKRTNIFSVLEKEQQRRQIRSAQRDFLINHIISSNSDIHNSAMGHFFNSMLLTTMSLPETSQDKVQRQIFNIVMEEKEKHT